MLSYFLKGRKNSESKNPKPVKSNGARIMLLSNCTVYNSENSRFIKEQEASVLVSSLELRTRLSQIPLVGSF